MGVPPPNLESTATLLRLVRHGDRPARERLAARYLQVLRRLAHGRLPLRARDLVDTDDLVQVTLIRALDHVEEFEPRHEGAFLAYMRRILLNQIRDEIRRVSRRPARSELEGDPPAQDPSPLEDAIGRETVERYEAILDQLKEEQREAIILRLELGFTYQQIAEALGRDSPNAVRMMVTRALVRLGEQLGGEPSDPGSSDER
jgi:RNA polymerase sigma-70 factor (ECF subfamily)